MSGSQSKAEQLVQQWVEQCVIDLSLCPFAAAPYRSGRVRIVICDAVSEEGFLATIETELDQLLDSTSVGETTLVAATSTLVDFLDFNDFLESVEALLQFDDLDQHFQTASFHPDYRFAGVDDDDVGNYTNRAPYPIVQWLRADTVAKAVDTMNTLEIPDANIEKLKSLKTSELNALFPWVGK